VLYYSQRKGNTQTKGAIKMYETVKIVNGYEIKRMKGTHGFYTVTFWKSESGKSSKYCTFNTIKAAAAFCETL
jgi:hypothetical protein